MDVVIGGNILILTRTGEPVLKEPFRRYFIGQDDKVYSQILWGMPPEWQPLKEEEYIEFKQLRKQPK